MVHSRGGVIYDCTIKPESDRLVPPDETKTEAAKGAPTEAMTAALAAAVPTMGPVYLSFYNKGHEQTGIEADTGRHALTGRHIGTGTGPTEHPEHGVYGEAWSTIDRTAGVYGIATAMTGDTFGVLGIANSLDGTGVYGECSADGGAARGVTGYSGSNDGIGVLGHGGFRGVWGKCDILGGAAVLAHHSQHGTALEAVGSVEVMGTNGWSFKVDNADPKSGETAMLVRVNAGGKLSLQRVLVGPQDSSGKGYRALRIPN